MEAIFIWSATLLLTVLTLWLYLSRTRKTERVHRGAHEEAVSLGINKPQAQHPMVDISRCIGCGSCVAACPEGGVLGLVGGKATIINGLRCVGHGKCAEACPVEAVKIGLGDLSQRSDLPLLGPDCQTNVAGIYIVGELGGLALVKNAVQQGVKAVEAMAREFQPAGDGCIHDLVVVGAGPAGLSAALASMERGFHTHVLDQEDAGGTILQYPRKKMMLTQPVEIPMYGWLKKNQYAKEELLEIWHGIIRKHEVSISRGEVLEQVYRRDHCFEVKTSKGSHYAFRVILALGRRGSPRKLGVPGEERGKVMYKLIDACNYENEDLLVVGGGDSAVEAAIALARQEGNRVTLSYRKSKFFRIKQLNLENIERAMRDGLVEVIFNSELESIEERGVRLKTEDGSREIPNDYVFIFAGGIPPYGLLKKIGIAFGGEAA